MAAAIAACLTGFSSARAGAYDDASFAREMRDETSANFFLQPSSFILFPAGPAWLMNAMPGNQFRTPFRSIYDRDGDRLDSVYRYANDVGTLASPYKITPFSVALFNNVSSYVGSGGTVSKTPTVFQADANTPYYYSGAGTANWSGPTTWGPGGGYPNGAGDSALNVQVVDGHVVQDVSGGVILGIIDNVPTTPGNSGNAVSWTITTDNPIILDSGSASPAQINNSQAVGTSSLTIDGTAGLRLNSNLTITNANPGGLITISAPIKEYFTPNRGITVVGPGTTIFSGNDNTYQGGTTINGGGTLLVNNATGSSGTGSGAVLVSNTGTLGGDGFIAGGDVTIASGGTITGGTNGTTGALTLTVANLNFDSGSIFHVDLGGSSTDLLAVSGLFNITNGATIEFNTLGTLTQNSYTLATYGDWNNIQFLAPSVPNGYQLIYGDDALILVAEPIPEPSTWVGAAMALGAIGFTQRRRLRACWQS